MILILHLYAINWRKMSRAETCSSAKMCSTLKLEKLTSCLIKASSSISKLSWKPKKEDSIEIICP